MDRGLAGAGIFFGGWVKKLKYVKKIKFLGKFFKRTGNLDFMKKWSVDDLRALPQADSKGIKKLIGNSDDGFKFFKNQIDVSTMKEVKPGVFIGKDANGLTFTYRAVSKSGPPTIDINGIKGIRKIKFLGE